MQMDSLSKAFVEILLKIKKFVLLTNDDTKIVPLRTHKWYLTYNGTIFCIREIVTWYHFHVSDTNFLYMYMTKILVKHKRSLKVLVIAYRFGPISYTCLDPYIFYQIIFLVEERLCKKYCLIMILQNKRKK